MIASQVVSEANVSMAVRKSLHSMNLCLKSHRLKRRGISSSVLKSSCGATHQRLLELRPVSSPMYLHSNARFDRGNPNRNDAMVLINKKSLKPLEPVYRPLYPSKRLKKRTSASFTIPRKVPYVPAFMLSRRKPVIVRKSSAPPPKSNTFFWPPIYKCKHQQAEKILVSWKKATAKQTQYPTWLMPIYAYKNAVRKNNSDESQNLGGHVANRRIEMYLKMKEAQLWKKTAASKIDPEPKTNKLPKSSQSVIELKNRIFEMYQTKALTKLNSRRPEETFLLSTPKQIERHVENRCNALQPEKAHKTFKNLSDTLNFEPKNKPTFPSTDKEPKNDVKRCKPTTHCPETGLNSHSGAESGVKNEAEGHEWTVQSLKARISLMQQGEIHDPKRHKVDNEGNPSLMKTTGVEPQTQLHSTRAFHDLAVDRRGLLKPSRALLNVPCAKVSWDGKRGMSSSSSVSGCVGKTKGQNAENEQKSWLNRVKKSAVFKKQTKVSFGGKSSPYGPLEELGKKCDLLQNNTEALKEQATGKLYSARLQKIKTIGNGIQTSKRTSIINWYGKSRDPEDWDALNQCKVDQAKTFRELGNKPIVPPRLIAPCREVGGKRCNSHIRSNSERDNCVSRGIPSDASSIRRNLSTDSVLRRHNLSDAAIKRNLRPIYSSTLSKEVQKEDAKEEVNSTLLTAPNKLIRPMKSDLNSKTLKTRVDELKILINKSKELSSRQRSLTESPEPKENHNDRLRRLLDAVKVNAKNVKPTGLRQSVENNLVTAAKSKNATKLKTPTDAFEHSIQVVPQQPKYQPEASNSKSPSFQNLLVKLKTFVSTVKDTSQTLQETLMNSRSDFRIKHIPRSVQEINRIVVSPEKSLQPVDPVVDFQHRSKKNDFKLSMKLKPAALVEVEQNITGITYGQVRSLLTKGVDLIYPSINDEVGCKLKKTLAEGPVRGDGGTAQTCKQTCQPLSCIILPGPASNFDSLTALVGSKNMNRNHIQTKTNLNNLQFSENPTSVTLSQLHFTFSNQNQAKLTKTKSATIKTDVHPGDALKSTASLANTPVDGGGLVKTMQSIRQEIRDSIRRGGNTRGTAQVFDQGNKFLTNCNEEKISTSPTHGHEITNGFDDHLNADHLQHSVHQGTGECCNCTKVNCSQCRLFDEIKEAEENNEENFGTAHNHNSSSDDCTHQQSRNSTAESVTNWQTSTDWDLPTSRCSPSEASFVIIENENRTLVELQSKDPMINADVLNTLKLPVTFDDFKETNWFTKK